MSRQIGIVAADAHPLVQTAICGLVSQQENIKWLGEATSVCQAIELCQSVEPDILLLAPNLADYDPPLSILRIQSACPTVKILIFSACTQLASARAALNASADGYVLKTEAVETIVQAIRTINQGVQWMSPALCLSEQKAQPMPNLSKREKNVLGLTITGKTDREMGQLLHIHERTVRYYLQQIYNKLGVNTRVEAVAQAFRLGLV